MRNLLILGMLAVAAFMAGWFKINRDEESTTIEFNRAEIRSDARRAIDKGRDILERREQQDRDRYAAQSEWPESNDPQQAGPAYENQAFGPPPNPSGFGQPAGYVESAYPPSSGYRSDRYPPRPYDSPSQYAAPAPYSPANPYPAAESRASQYPPQPYPRPAQSSPYPEYGSYPAAPDYPRR